MTHCSDYFITQVDVESIIAKNDSNTGTNGNNNTNTDDVNNNNDIIKETSDKELNDVKASKDLPKTGSRVSTDVLTTTSLIILALGVALMVRPRKREQ
ncbi:hypothetical protein GNF64_16130 [Clostridium perfringens]|nr:hypothetical protein [Clostridium perfringens]